MKIIDSKGKLFGKINILDFIIIAVIIVLILASVRFFFASTDAEVIQEIEKEHRTIQLTVLNAPDYLINSVSAGDSEYSNRGELFATILDKEIKPNRNGGNDLIITADILVNRDLNEKLYFKSFPLLVNYEIKIYTNKTYILGRVSSLDPRLNEEESI